MQFNINTHINPGRLYQIKISLYVNPWSNKNPKLLDSPPKSALIELEKNDIILVLNAEYNICNYFRQMRNKEDLEAYDISLEMISKYGQNFIQKAEPTSQNHDSILSLKEITK